MGREEGEEGETEEISRGKSDGVYKSQRRCGFIYIKKATRRPRRMTEPEATRSA
jgi:hypothetical protein